MNESDIRLLAHNGWVVECESPLEISHEDGSFVSGLFVNSIIEQLKLDLNKVIDNSLIREELEEIISKCKQLAKKY